MKLDRHLRTFGIEPFTTYRALRGLRTYRRNRLTYDAQRPEIDVWPDGERFPCLTDRYDESGVAEGQYFHQDLLVAQRIFSARPEKHVDVGSRVDGFVAHVATFMPVEVMDIRPLRTSAANIDFTRRDVTVIDQSYDNYTDSLSCLHALEHIGLGRYGDEIDYWGHQRGLENLARMVRADGTLYLSVPISRHQRVEFDAHRLFAVPHIVELVRANFDVSAADLIDDTGELVRDVDLSSPAAARSFEVNYGCLVLTLTKLRTRP
jgi:hypothetical protein